MSTVTLPMMAKTTANVVQDALAEPLEARSRQEWAALVQACDFIAGLFRGFLQGVNESLAEGVGSRSLQAKLNEGIEAGTFALEQCLALQRKIDANSAIPQALTDALKKATAEIQKVHGELVSMAEWINAPPPLPDLEKLKEASKGPFVPMRK
ncbi:MAG TPA: hypothetical protein VH575_15855 [Gemmataceae bacterium]|jgi:hypothetical protein